MSSGRNIMSKRSLTSRLVTFYIFWLKFCTTILMGFVAGKNEQKIVGRKASRTNKELFLILSISLNLTCTHLKKKRLNYNPAKSGKSGFRLRQIAESSPHTWSPSFPIRHNRVKFTTRNQKVL